MRGLRGLLALARLGDQGQAGLGQLAGDGGDVVDVDAVALEVGQHLLGRLDEGVQQLTAGIGLVGGFGQVPALAQAVLGLGEIERSGDRGQVGVEEAELTLEHAGRSGDAGHGQLHRQDARMGAPAAVQYLGGRARAGGFLDARGKGAADAHGVDDLGGARAA